MNLLEISFWTVSYLAKYHCPGYLHGLIAVGEAVRYD